MLFYNPGKLTGTVDVNVVVPLRRVGTDTDLPDGITLPAGSWRLVVGNPRDGSQGGYDAYLRYQIGTGSITQIFEVWDSNQKWWWQPVTVAADTTVRIYASRYGSSNDALSPGALMVAVLPA